MKPEDMWLWTVLAIFFVGSYLLTPPLIVKSATAIQNEMDLEFSTYIGGIDDDSVYAMTTDQEGNIYIVGYTSSSDFPTTHGAYDESFNGGSYFPQDGFVTKLSSDGQSIIYSTFIGGSSDDAIGAITVDELGNAYIAGTTDSPDFPTVNAYDSTHNSGLDCFVAILSADGSNLLFSTYIGGSGDDTPSDMAVDSNGSCFIVGITDSPDFPVNTPNVHSSCHTLGGDSDGFILRLDTTNSELVHSMYLGGDGVVDDIYTIGLDSQGNAVAAGFTWSLDYPIVNALDDTMNGSTDCVITKIDSNGSIIFSTYYGGSDSETIYKVHIHQNDDIYLVGNTISDDFPHIDVTKPELSAERGVFLSIVDSNATEIRYSGVIEDSYQEGIYTSAHAMYMVSDDLIWIGGSTMNDQFPITDDAFDSSIRESEGFLLLLDLVNESIVYSSYYGGSGRDGIADLCMNGAGDLIGAGVTSSLNLPIKNALNTTINNDENFSDGFVFCLAKTVTTTPPPDIFQFTAIVIGISVIGLVVIVVILKKPR
jgi:hypothetical protein